MSPGASSPHASPIHDAALASDSDCSVDDNKENDPQRAQTRRPSPPKRLRRDGVSRDPSTRTPTPPPPWQACATPSRARHQDTLSPNVRDAGPSSASSAAAAVSGQHADTPRHSAMPSGSASAGPSGSRASESRQVRAPTRSSQDPAPKSSSSNMSDAPLDSKASAELNAMLSTNIQRIQSVNEQLVQIMEGTAPPGTDAEWLRMSRNFLTTRIDSIRGILADRGSPTFTPASSSRAAAAATTTSTTVSPSRSKGVAQQPAILLSSPLHHGGNSSIMGFSDDEEDVLPASFPNSPVARIARERGSPSVTEVHARQQDRPVPRAAPQSQRPLPGASVRPQPPIDDLGSLDAAIFDEDEEALMAEIHGFEVVPAPRRDSHAESRAPAVQQHRSSQRLSRAGPSSSASASGLRLSSTPTSRPGSESTAPTSPLTSDPSDGPARKKDRVRSKEQMNYPWSRDVAKALKRTFGLQEFRSNQLEAINATLNGEDVFCLMPTGGGKSLCYQLPALLDSGRTEGVTVVISPLLSLIHDQVRHLLNLTVPALMLTGDMQGERRDFALSELFSKEPTTRLLYITPEFVGRSRQAMDIFTSLFRKKKLARFVIDEAHCVSQWGHDFRPDYQTLGKLRQEFPGIPMMAMTATANHRVKTDLVNSLGIRGCKVLEQSFNRANLKYEVREKNQKTVIADIARFIQASHKGQCGIVYCLSRRACEEVAARLSSEHSLEAQHYHAALTKQDRLAIQEAWQAGKFRIIVATIAFGMGIDKGDVRFVVHHTLPQSLEGYYQETGRAGRDGKSSTCVLFFNYRDTNIIKRMIDDGEGTKEQKDQQHANLRRVVTYCMNKHDCRRTQVLQYFGEAFSSESCHHTCDNCCNMAANHHQAVVQDLTTKAKQAAELVQDLGNRGRGQQGGFTMLHFVDVFRGSQSRLIRDRGHHQHRFAGAGSSMNRGDVERLFQDLVIREVLHERSEVNSMGFAHAYLELGSEAPALLEGRIKIELSVQRPSAAAPAFPPRERIRIISTAESMRDDDFEEFDAFDISNVDLSPSPEPVRTVSRIAPRLAAKPIQRTASLEFTTRPAIDLRGQGGATGTDGGTCYSALVKLRDEMAAQRQCLKSAIFDDGTLRRMSVQLPTGIAQFVAIPGVGDDKYESFGRDFLDICKRFAASSSSRTPVAAERSMAKSTSATFNLGNFAYAEPGSKAAQKRRATASASVSPVKRASTRTTTAAPAAAAPKRFRPRMSEGNVSALTSRASPSASGPVVEGRPRPLQRTVTSHMPVRLPSANRPSRSAF